VRPPGPWHFVVTILAAAWVGYSAAALFFRARWVVQALTDYGVPRWSWPCLGTAETAGAAARWSLGAALAAGRDHDGGVNRGYTTRD
jgi:DoxX-like family